MPKFSILLPTHDHADMLFWSVASVQAQTQQDFELLIVGDGVPDRTREVVAALQQHDRRIRFFDNPKGPNRGELHRHQALQEAQGDLICYQCDDDLWLPEHLETLEGALSDHNLAHTMQFEIHPGQSNPSTWFFNAQIPAEVEALRQRQTGFGTAATGHTAAAYRRLPFGWRTTPSGHSTDLYMWLQFLDQPWCRPISVPRPTVVRFPSADHKEWTVSQRAAEMAFWSARLATPANRLAFTRSALEPLCSRTYAEKLNAVQRATIVTSALDALRPQSAPRAPGDALPANPRLWYEPGTVLNFNAGGRGCAFLAYGFCEPETWGVWSADSAAAIVLPLQQKFAGVAELHLNHTAFLAAEHHEQLRIILSVNGVALDDWDVTLEQPSSERIVQVPGRCLEGTSQVTIQFALEHPMRPIDAGLSKDSRLLGMGLMGLSLQRAA